MTGHVVVCTRLCLKARVDVIQYVTQRFFVWDNQARVVICVLLRGALCDGSSLERCHLDSQTRFALNLVYVVLLPRLDATISRK